MASSAGASAAVRVVASNLHRGGGVQVAASLVTELVRNADVPVDRVVFEVSPEVAANLPAEVTARARVEVVDRRPSSLGLWWWRDLRRREPTTLVVFSPAWFPVRGRRRVCGYADVTALYADVPGLPGPGPRARAKAWLSRRQLRRFDAVAVETRELADRLVEQVPELASRVHVVPNVVSDVVLHGTAPVDVPPAPAGTLTLAYPTAAYHHKNLAYLGPLADALVAHGVRVRYLLTCAHEDFERLPASVRERAVDLGPVRQEQVAAVLAAADGVIFPSLLEASSATPLEAMALGKPLFASDRAFVRTVCGDAAHYLDPCDPEQGAAAIAAALADPACVQAGVERGRARSAALPTAADRAARFWRLLTDEPAEPAEPTEPAEPAEPADTAPRPRLLVVNNLPAFYRAPLYRALAEELDARTGGSTLVAFAVRRAPGERDEWFFTPDAELDFAHRFTQPVQRRLAGRRLPGRPGLGLLRRYRPTHVFTAGWDTPLSLATARWAARHGARLAVWVESSSLTTRHRNPLLDRVRRGFLAPADLAVVPTESSARHVADLAGRDVAALRLLNPVALDRLPDDPAAPQRAVFVGDLSARKGFDRYAAAADQLRAAGLAPHAWGRDVEGLAMTAEAAGVVVHPPTPPTDLVEQLSPNDVLVVPSRVDPAPLTVSEGIALGLRIVVSTDIGYAELADDPTLDGAVTAADCADPATLAAAAHKAALGPRPKPETAEQVAPAYFARRLLDRLLAP